MTDNEIVIKKLHEINTTVVNSGSMLGNINKTGVEHQSELLNEIKAIRKEFNVFLQAISAR